jgi:hypothetical protein
MVQGRRKIIWTIIARTTRNSIFSYWNNRNKSNLYSKKLFVLFNETLERIAQFPQTSLATNSSNIRYVLVRDYYLIFEISELTINVLDIWDTRQNPQNFPIK